MARTRAKPLPADAIIPADLSDWSYQPPRDHVAVDPVLGRMTFRPSQLPKKSEVERWNEVCSAEVNIRHCTFVPGWSLSCDCEPKRPAEPSLELFNVHARVRIEHSIIGSVQVNEDQVHTDPIPISITDSILDATGNEREALGAPGRPAAHAVLTILRCTVFDKVLVHAIELAKNCIFNSCLNVARRQLGCMRFCYVPPGCRTPLNSVRYGRHDYAQLADLCAEEIKRGADDESEMGVFHDLLNPQREANLLMNTHLQGRKPVSSL